MHPDVHRHLDGEVPRSALDANARAELERWESLVRTEDASNVRAPGDLEDRVMAAIGDEAPEATSPAIGAGGIGIRAWRWLVAPRVVRVRPAWGLAAAAVLVALALGAPGLFRNPAGPTALAAPGSGDAPVYVQFVYDGPAARSVSVAGDFNGWQTNASPLQDPDGDGVWTAMFPLRPGMHSYMFVVNGSEWVTDPRATRHVEDGFGMTNALISVGAADRGAT